MKIDNSAFFESGAIISLDQRRFLVCYGIPIKKALQEQLGSLPAFYFPDFFLENKTPWIQYSEWKELTLEELEADLEFSSLPNLSWHNPYFHSFKETFESLQDSFRVNNLKKAVPYVFVHSDAKMTRPRLEHALKTSLSYLKDYPGYLYGYWSKEEGILGVTPELLFNYLPDQRIETVALAGTSPKTVCQTLFKKDPKEQYEHQLVVQGIKHSLEAFGTVQIGECTVLSLPTLNHLITSIQVNLLEQVNFYSLVCALHPTPALGAFPKEAGQQWLKNYESKIRRNRYGAPVGCYYPQKKHLKCFVGIRNVQWDKNQMRIGAGCGIVPSSQLEKEWKEIDLKINSIRRLLAL